MAARWPVIASRRWRKSISANVARLQQVCAYVLPEVAALQTGPLVVDGTMYFTTDTISYAIDGATCQEKWRVARHSGRNASLVHRGFAWLDGRLFRGTTDGHVLALAAADGRVVWDQALDVSGPGISYPMAPIAADGLVFIGNAGGDNAGVTGHVFALDVRDGHVVWRFDVVPAAGPARAHMGEHAHSTLRRRVLDVVHVRRGRARAVRAGG